jgi:hypothetical protein
MDSAAVAIRFVMAALAVWRLSHLVSREDGPFASIARLRGWLGDRRLGRLLDCPFCLSMWFAIPGALFLRVPALETAVGWLALSGAACVIERAIRAPVVFETLPDGQSEGKEMTP